MKTANSSIKKAAPENRQNNDVSNISYDVGDCFSLALDTGAVTGATAMELIEHLPVDQVDNFVKEVRRVVAPRGRRLSCLVRVWPVGWVFGRRRAAVAPVARPIGGDSRFQFGIAEIGP